MKKKIIVPTDLTMAAQKAIGQATAIARKSGSSVTLLHIMDEKSASADEIKKSLHDEAERINKNSGVSCEVLIQAGNIFESIPYVASDKEYDLMVIGTHGMKGIKQNLFGSNILKLVSRIPLPVLVMQEQSPVIESFHKLVLPVSSHSSFLTEVDAILLLAGLFDLEVYLYSIHKPGFPWPDQLLKNIEDATRIFETKGIQMKRIKEEQKVYSQGYSKQTLLFAHETGADILCMISVPSEEYYYFAPSDKEAMLLNEYHIPVLCTCGGKG
jgi:nucleotide-binding universal stress UspA family protein